MQTLTLFRAYIQEVYLRNRAAEERGSEAGVFVDNDLHAIEWRKRYRRAGKLCRVIYARLQIDKKQTEWIRWARRAIVERDEKIIEQGFRIWDLECQNRQLLEQIEPKE